MNFVEGFVHERLYEISSDDLVRARSASLHALGDVRTEERLPEVEDFTCPFAFQHLFHAYIEQRGNVPTWQDIREWLLGEVRDL